MSRRARIEAACLSASCALLLAFLLVSPACGDKVAPLTEGEAEYDVYGHDGSLLEDRPRPDAPLPNLVLIVASSMRRDAVGASMPRLAAFARDAVTFRNATTPATATAPSLTSMLTGLMPHEHGCTSSFAAPKLLSSFVTYAEALGRGHGYETVVFSNGPWRLGAPRSILQGFGSGTTAATNDSSQQARGFAIGLAPERIDEWLATRDPKRPFFLFLHTLELHDPYGPDNHPPTAGFGSADAEALNALADTIDVSTINSPATKARGFLLDRATRHALFHADGPRFRETVAAYMWSGFRDEPDPALLADTRRAYAESATNVDVGLHATIARLRERGLLEDTLLAITSAHGEAFAEHGDLGHGRSLYDELVTVPLILSGPGPFARAKVVDAPAGVIDVLPTFFDWARLPDISRSDGRSLLPALEGRAERSAVLTEAVIEPEIATANVQQVAVSARSAAWKYEVVYDVGEGTVVERLFDMLADPGEQRDLAVDGRIPDVGFPVGFCSAVESARDLIWSDADDIGALAITAYGAGVGQIRTRRPEPCTSRR